MADFLSAEVFLHFGRIQPRLKKGKHSGVILSDVLARKPAKVSFSDDVVSVMLSCDRGDHRGGLRIEITEKSNEIFQIKEFQINEFPYSFTQNDIIPYGIISDIYISSTDFQKDLEKMADWLKYFERLDGHTLTNVDDVENFVIVTKDLGFYLFYLEDKRDSLQQTTPVRRVTGGLKNQIRNILLALYNNKNLHSKSSSIAGIQFLDRHNLCDASMLCPFNNEGEWGAEVSSCVANFDAGIKNGFILEIRRNPTWSNNLSQFYVVPRLFPSTVWLFTHSNGSMLFSAPDKNSAILKEGFGARPLVFDIEQELKLCDSGVSNRIASVFSDLAHQVIADHYKDWLASSSLFWTAEGQFAASWIDLVSKVLELTSQVVKAVVSGRNTPVLLASYRRSVCLVVAALAQLCLSPSSRASIKSINRLIQKYFVSLGFPFRLEPNQPDPLFILFLDCFYQLVCQNPMEFGIKTDYLKALAVSFVSDHFYEFSFSSPSKRVDACRRDQHSYRWFFPIEQNFDPELIFVRFVNPLFNPQKLTPKFATEPDLAKPLDRPIPYYPFNSGAEKEKAVKKTPINSFTRSQSAENLADEKNDRPTHGPRLEMYDNEDAISTVSQARVSFSARVSHTFSNMFRQRTTSTFYQPLFLTKATLNQPFPSPYSYFGAKKPVKTQVIMPRYQRPCIRFWSDFMLAHEYDFDYFEFPPGGVSV